MSACVCGKTKQQDERKKLQNTRIKAHSKHQEEVGGKQKKLIANKPPLKRSELYRHFSHETQKGLAAVPIKGGVLFAEVLACERVQLQRYQFKQLHQLQQVSKEKQQLENENFTNIRHLLFSPRLQKHIVRLQLH